MVLTSPWETSVTPECDPDAAGCTAMTGAACGAGASSGVKRSLKSSRIAYLDLVRSGLAFAEDATVDATPAEPAASECAERDGAEG